MLLSTSSRSRRTSLPIAQHHCRHHFYHDHRSVLNGASETESLHYKVVSIAYDLIRKKTERGPKNLPFVRSRPRATKQHQVHFTEVNHHRRLLPAPRARPVRGQKPVLLRDRGLPLGKEKQPNLRPRQGVLAPTNNAIASPLIQ